MKYVFALLLMFVAMPTRAEVFVWTDPKFDLTMAFPEDWMRQTQTPDDLRLHVLAPQGTDLASCRIFASDDGRFLYVPPRGQHEVAQFTQDSDTLRALLQNRMGYSNARLIGYQNIGSLGKGPATVAMAQYSKTWNGKNHDMQSIQFGGYMNGMKTVYHCEALAQSWGRWQPIFMNILKSIDFPAQYGPVPQGYYRDFMSDGYVFLPAGYQQGRGKR